MENSSLEKLWEGTLPLGSLKKLNMTDSRYLKNLPDLSNAINLEKVYLHGCTSLVTLHSSIWNLLKLQTLDLKYCEKLKKFPIQRNLESLQRLDLRGCIRLKDFPQIYMSPCARENTIEVEDCFWNKKLSGLDYLGCLMACMPSKFRPEHLVHLTIKSNMLEKLWEGVQPLGNLWSMDLSECEKLREIPDLSKATNLGRLELNNCKRLVMIPSSVGNLNKLEFLCMKGCTRLELLPTGVNLISLKYLDLDGCSRLKSFPQISTNITHLYLDHTAIEEVPALIENFSRLIQLKMSGCKELIRISPNIYKLECLEYVNFSYCGGVTSLSTCTKYYLRLPEAGDAPFLQRASPFFFNPNSGFILQSCFNLSRNARKFLIQSVLNYAILLGEEMTTYFTHQVNGSSLTITLPQIPLSQGIRFKFCVMLDPPTEFEVPSSRTGVEWDFRGKHFKYYLNHSNNMEGHLIMFYSEFFTHGLSDPPFESNEMRCEFSTHHVSPSICCFRSKPSVSSQRIKSCGVRVLTFTPDSTSRSSEIEYNQGDNQGDSDNCSVM